MRDIPVLKLNLKEPEKFGNLAEKLDEDERRTLATDLIELIGVDKTSMNTWLGEAEGFLTKLEEGNEPTPSGQEEEGSNEEAPPATELTLSAMVQFTARATDALLGEPDLAKASEVGAEPLAAWVSSQLRTKDPDWLADTDPLLAHMSATGLAWRKRDFDTEDQVFHTSFRRCGDIILNANVRSVPRAPRITDEFERYPYEIQRSIERKKWVDYNPVFEDRDPQAPKRFYDCDCWLDFDGDGLEEPWSIVISLDDTPEVIRIRPRWSRKTVTDNDKELYFRPINRFYPYRFLPHPNGKFFPMGFGKLLDRTENTADQLLASIVDTAKSEAENGGVYTGEGLGLPDKVELKNNRATKIGSDGRTLSDMWSPFPTKTVSPGSVQLLDKIITLGDRVAGTLNLLENAPASMTATLAKGVIDNGTQVQSAVHRRLCTALTGELRDFISMADAYDQLPDGMTLSQASGIAVTADPQLATEMHRSALGGVYMEMLTQAAEGVPWAMPVIQRRFCETMRLANPAEMIAPPKAPEASPVDKMKMHLGLLKHRNDAIKTIGGVAVQLTQSMKNLVEASGGMQDQRAALLQMASLEHTVQQMLNESQNASSFIDGMAGQSGDPDAGGLPSPAPGGGGDAVPAGAAGGPGSAGPGGGAA